MGEKAVEERKVILLHSDGEGVQAERAARELACEVSLKIHLNGSPLLSLLCLDGNLDELALGFLYTEGIIDSRRDVTSWELNELLYTLDVRLAREIAVQELESLQSVTSGCGKGVTFLRPEREEKLERLENDHRIAAARVWEWMRAFDRQSRLHRKIGGVHSAMLRCRSFTLFSEDIGRHNCIDRIAGRLLTEDRLDSAQEATLLTSGRVSSEIMTKLIRLKVPILLSRSAPTAAAARLAEDYNITLLGYVRAGGAIIYAGAERVLL